MMIVKTKIKLLNCEKQQPGEKNVKIESARFWPLPTLEMSDLLGSCK